ncbi:hypothetical protein AB6802_26445 [Mesorhizobium sp. RCC_202]|uniref:hypothetical protein n=1 Tax=Mesorhizobium sp. RCC_202 TaxID=3239222 RepID=UPI003524EE73
MTEQRQTKLVVLRDDIRKGQESGLGIPVSEVLDRLEAKYREPQPKEESKPL